MTKTSRRFFRLALSAALAAQTIPALALDDGDKEAIRVLSNEAAADYDQARYDAARDKFLRAYEIAKVPRLAVWAARANVKLGRLVAAYELYRQARSLQPNDLWRADTQQKAQQEAETELQALQPRIPRITISISGVSAKEVAVKLDNADVPSPLLGVERLADPGTREVVGKLGEQVVSERVTLAEGEQKQVILRFRAAEKDGAASPAHPGEGSTPRSASTPPSTLDAKINPPSSQRTWGWTSLGVGVAGLAVGLTTGAMVAVKYGDLKDKCGGTACSPQYESEVGTYYTLQVISTVGLVVGGLATAAGVTLLLVSPKQESAASLGWWISPASTGLRGAF